MEVFKFGGASVCDAASVKNVGCIVRQYSTDELIIVISAMGKMTNAFELLLEAYIHDTDLLDSRYDAIYSFHRKIIEDLFPDTAHTIYNELESVFQTIQRILQSSPSENIDYEYDRLVSYGEVLSSLILSSYLNINGISNVWLDARRIIKTDRSFREAEILWGETKTCFTRALAGESSRYYVIQGFIGGTRENVPTTLGREGSDYTAALAAYCLDASRVTIWKDVAGVLHADPRYEKNAQKIDRLSYHDAIELTYYGAKVIHPRTIKPLQNKTIPLYVKSFVKPEDAGTEISDTSSTIPCPVYIIKQNQLLMTVSPCDFSFITEKNLSDIFTALSNNRIRLNLMQNSALSFSMSLDNEPKKIDTYINQLKRLYKIRYNAPVQLVTVWHHDDDTIARLTQHKEVLLEEKTRYTVQLVTREREGG